MEYLKVILEIVEAVLFIIASIIIKFRPGPKSYNPMLLSDILIDILCGIVLIFGLVVTSLEFTA